MESETLLVKKVLRDSDLADLNFQDKWALLINSMCFMVAGMLILMVSWRSRKAEKINESAFYYVFMSKGSGSLARNTQER